MMAHVCIFCYLVTCGFISAIYWKASVSRDDHRGKLYRNEKYAWNDDDLSSHIASTEYHQLYQQEERVIHVNSVVEIGWSVRYTLYFRTGIQNWFFSRYRRFLAFQRLLDLLMSLRIDFAELGQLTSLHRHFTVICRLEVTFLHGG